MKKLFSVLFLVLIFSCLNTTESNQEKSNGNNLIYQDESNFLSIRQVTYGGDNAEAYWSFDDKKLVLAHDFDENGEETTLDYKRILEIVKSFGYTGYIGVEYEGLRLSEVEGIKATRDLLIKAGKSI